MVADVAVLYSGRFFGSGTSAWSTTLAWAQNHLEHLIRPNAASVFLVASAINWCGASEAAREAIASGQSEQAQALLEADVRAAFQGWPHVHCAFIPSQQDVELDANLTAQTIAAATGKFKVGVGRARSVYAHMVVNWRWQLAHLARADELRRRHGSHHVIVRARLDAVFESVALIHRVLAVGAHHLLALGPACDPAPGTEHNRSGVICPISRGLPKQRVPHEAQRSAEPDYWADWFFAGRPKAFASLVQLAYGRVVLASNTSRCFGMCQEEQTVLQLQARGTTLSALGWRVQLARVPCLGVQPAVDVSPTDEWTSPCSPRGGWRAMPMSRNCTVRMARPSVSSNQPAQASATRSSAQRQAGYDIRDTIYGPSGKG